MGSGINAARELAPEHAKLLDDMKDQLLIVLMNRLGGKVSIPVSEIDDTGGYMASMSLNDGVFNFEVGRKQ